MYKGNELIIVKKLQEGSCGLLKYRKYFILFTIVNHYNAFSPSPLIKLYKTFYDEAILSIKDIEKDSYLLSISSKLILPFSLINIRTPARKNIIYEINNLINLENTLDNLPYIWGIDISTIKDMVVVSDSAGSTPIN